MTFEDAIAEAIVKTPFTADDIGDLRLAYEQDMAHPPAPGQVGELEAIMRTYRNADRGIDRTAWQTLGVILGAVVDGAEKVTPFVSTILSIAAFL